MTKHRHATLLEGCLSATGKAEKVDFINKDNVGGIKNVEVDDLVR